MGCINTLELSLTKKSDLRKTNRTTEKNNVTFEHVVTFTMVKIRFHHDTFLFHHHGKILISSW
jgi:hypothetical protein